MPGAGSAPDGGVGEEDLGAVAAEALVEVLGHHGGRDLAHQGDEFVGHLPVDRA